MIALILSLALAGPLAPFDYWVGHCWITDIAPGTTDRHCFTAIYGGAHVRDVHEVVSKGKTVYAGETLYSVEGGKLTFTYWNSTGGIGRGTVTPGPELRFAMRMRGSPDAPEQDYTTVWRRTPDGYEATTGNVTRRFRRDDR